MSRTCAGRTAGMAMCVAIVFGVGVRPAPAQQAAAARGPTPESLAGTYEGTAVGPDGEGLPLLVELRYADGQFTGYVDAQVAQLSVVAGTLAGDSLTLTIDSGGMTGAMSGTVVESSIEGTWTLGDMQGSFTVTKRAPAPPAAAPADPISGAWVGEVYVQGQAMPFSLTLKVAGDTVTGDIESAMGTVPLTGGAWKDGTLTILFPYVGGEPVSMGAQLKDGKLEGIVDYNTGELQGTWVASRK